MWIVEESRILTELYVFQLYHCLCHFRVENKAYTCIFPFFVLFLFYFIFFFQAHIWVYNLYTFLMAFFKQAGWGNGLELQTLKQVLHLKQMGALKPLMKGNVPCKL